MMYLGDYPTGATVRIPWSTNASDGSAVTRTANGTVRIYKNSSTTERSSLNGVTDNEDWATITGIHVLTIDLSDNTDAGFYAAGSDYMVAVTGQTIDGIGVSVFIGAFSIQNRYSSASSATNLPKNVAFSNFLFLLTSSATHLPLTGKVNADFTTKVRSLDGAAFAVGTMGTITEVSGGWYKLDLGAGDLNANNIAFQFGTADSDVTELSVFTNS